MHRLYHFLLPALCFIVFAIGTSTTRACMDVPPDCEPSTTTTTTATPMICEIDTVFDTTGCLWIELRFYNLFTMGGNAGQYCTCAFQSDTPLFSDIQGISYCDSATGIPLPNFNNWVPNSAADAAWQTEFGTAVNSRVTSISSGSLPNGLSVVMKMFLCVDSVHLWTEDSVEMALADFSVGLAEWDNANNGLTTDTAHKGISTPCFNGSNEATGWSSLAGGFEVFSTYFERYQHVGDQTFYSRGGTDILVGLLDGGGDLVWGTQIGGASQKRFDEDYPDYPAGVVTDAQENVYVAGTIDGETRFGSFTIHAGSRDAFLAKYNRNGQLQWVRHLEGTDESRAYGLALDGQGNPVITGYFESWAVIGGDTLHSAGVGDVFLVKYDSNGGVLWKRRAGSPQHDRANAVAVDAQGNIWLTGSYKGVATFGSGTNAVTLTHTLEEDIFLVKYDANGNLLDGLGIPGTGMDFGRGIATDQAGNVFLVGEFEHEIEFSPTTTFSSFSPFSEKYDIWIAKYDAQLNLQWARQEGGVQRQRGKDIVVTPAGQVFVTGHFFGDVDFGPVHLQNFDATHADIFVAKYDNATGNLLQVNHGGGMENDYSTVLAVNAQGGVCYSGCVFGVATIEGQRIVPHGMADMYFSCFADTTAVGAQAPVSLTAVLYPNPATNAFYLEIKAETMRSGRVTIVDGQGRSLVDRPLTGPRMRIALPDSWASGIYFVRIHAGEKSHTQKLVVSR